MSDGIIWKPAMFKGSNVWVRVPADDSTEPYISESTGKACVKYKTTPKANWYWCESDLVELKPAEEVEDEQNGGGRRSKRRRGPEAAEEAAAEQEEDRKKPRTADNGKLYGVMEGSASRKQYVRGKDLKNNCAKCGSSLAGEAHIAFIEAPRSKTVKRSYGDTGSKWAGQFSFQDRDFFHFACWDVPKTAQRSLRGVVDICGFDELPEDGKALVLSKLPLLSTE